MSGSERSSLTGRLAALATLAVSAVMFAFAVTGISSIDPAANASAPVAPDVVRGLSIDQPRDRDCPFRRLKDRDRMAPDTGARDRDEPARDGVAF